MPVEKEERQSQNLLMRIPSNLHCIHRAVICFIAYLLLGHSTLLGQSSINTLLGKLDPQQYANSIAEKAKKLEDKLVAKSMKVLDKLQQQEEKIFHKLLSTKDSIQAKASLADLKGKYAGLKNKLQNPAIISQAKQYIPQLDSLSTSLKFLTEHGIGGKVKDAFAKTESLKDKFQQAEEIKKFIKERKELLKQQLEKLGMVKQLKQINKQVYYYTAQVKEYKEILKDPKKIEKKALALLSKTKVFQNFMKKNGMLASLLGFRQDLDATANIIDLTGLQSRAQINQLIQQQIAAGGPNIQQQMQQNMQSAQQQFQLLKDKINQAGGNNADLEMPDFKVNDQKTKSFMKRLEYSANVQSQKSTSFFPGTSDLGFGLGYKLSDKSVIGIGASYKMGWGNGWNNIRISHQGIGLRTYADLKIKGSIWISSGYEQNYRSAFNNFSILEDRSIWQSSGLLGISKKYKVSKKLTGKAQLLWDFLSYEQIPRVQPIIFRIGFSLK